MGIETGETRYGGGACHSAITSTTMTMNQNLKDRFSIAYHKLYGIIPELLWDGQYYRSPHLPMAMTPRRMQSHVARLEARTA